MPDETGRPHDAVQKEQEMREEERKGREHAEAEESPLGTPDDDAMPAPPGNVQGGGLGGAS